MRIAVHNLRKIRILVAHPELIKTKALKENLVELFG
jgi:hypothetical protein